MEERAYPVVAGPDFHAVILVEYGITSQELDGLKDGEWIIQCAEWVDADIETEISQLSSDVV